MKSFRSRVSPTRIWKKFLFTSIRERKLFQNLFCKNARVPDLSGHRNKNEKLIFFRFRIRSTSRDGLRLGLTGKIISGFCGSFLLGNQLLFLIILPNLLKPFSIGRIFCWPFVDDSIGHICSHIADCTSFMLVISSGSHMYIPLNPLGLEM